MASLDPGRSIGCVILAAGANERLKNIVPSGLKPLILVDGKPLIHHALEHAQRWNVGSTTIVVSPTNAASIISVCPDEYNYVCQPSPLGVVDAIRRAMPFITERYTLILCADNLFKGDVPEVISGPMMAARQLPREQAKRFTRYVLRRGEHNDPLDPGVFLIEANAETYGDGCWIGPLILPSEELKIATTDTKQTVVEMIRACTHGGVGLQVFPMMCSDCGIPEAL